MITAITDQGLGSDDRRLLAAMERLLAIGATQLRPALDEACQLVAEALGADKVDAMLLDPATDSLVAMGTSRTEMGRKQHAIGMDRLPLANGGREVAVYQSGEPYLTARADGDPEQLRGVVDGLGVRSAVIVPLDVAGERRGVFMAATRLPDRFREDELVFVTAVARWVGMVAHRAELVERVAAEAAERGRRAAADELMATLAHDLGNAIAPLKLRLDAVRRRVRAEGRARDLADLEAADRSLLRFSRMVLDLLDSSRLQRDVFELRPEPADLVAIAHDCAEVYRTPDRPIAVAGPASLVAELDPDRIRQVLENLLANAVKHTPAGTPIEIAADLPPALGGHAAVVTVSDRGPGIAPELLPRLFERFARAETSNGLGLGLYLAKRIVEAHGGELTVHSAPGSGATFRLRLPVDAAGRDGLAGSSEPA